MTLGRRDLLRLGALATVASGTALLSGCGDHSAPGGSGTGSTTKDKPTAPRHPADSSALRPGADSVRVFAADLFGAVATGSDNLVCSPYSVAVALAMTRQGAHGRTAQEMDAVLHAGADLATYTARMNALTQHLDGLASSRVTLASANSLWGQAGLTWRRAFLDTLGADFGAVMHDVDYAKAAEKARVQINSWTSKRTRERIPHLLAPGIVRSDTRLVLVNAIYLKAPWATPFEKDLTSDAPFTRADGSHVQVPMMTGDPETRLRYARGAGWQAVDLPYKGNGLAMCVLLPDATDGLDALAGNLKEQWPAMYEALRPASVALRMPRWRFRTQLELKSVLEDLAMPTAFSDAADFSAMTADAQLAIAAVVHEAFIEVTEAGTEAAAATAVVMRETAARMPDAPVTLDRPFLFVLHDVMTGTPLFTGRVSDPSAH